MIFGPRPLPYFPSKWESPECVADCLRESARNSVSISPEWQSARISKLEDSGRLSVIPAEELLISMSSFGGAEKRTSTFPLRLATLTLPPAFRSEERRVGKERV